MTNTLANPAPHAVVAGEAESPDGPEPEKPDPAEHTGAGWAIQLQLETVDCDPPVTGWLERELSRIAAMADSVTCGSLNLVVVDDAAMTELHSQYKHDATTTDVLTFDLRESGDDPVEGDIVICLDEAARQAKTRGHDTRLELLLYAVHGLLHLLGEDDHDPDDYRKMHRRENELLTQAGYGPVFGSTE